MTDTIEKDLIIDSYYIYDYFINLQKKSNKNKYHKEIKQ